MEKGNESFVAWVQQPVIFKSDSLWLARQRETRILPRIMWFALLFSTSIEHHDAWIRMTASTFIDAFCILTFP